MIRKHSRSNILHIEPCMRSVFWPGDLVRHYGDNDSHGIVLAVEHNGYFKVDGTIEEALTVLWSCVPNTLRHVVLPTIKRMFGRTIAQDLISIQPMSPPTGQIFYWEYKYGGK